MKKRIIIYLVLFQLLFIVVLLTNIYEKKVDVLGSSVNHISKNAINTASGSNLKFFYEPKPNSQESVNLDWMGNKYDYKVKYKINSDSLNQEKNYSVSKVKDVYRIVTLGDSFTFGVNVNTEDNYPSQLQNLLDECQNETKFEVLNLGVAGYDNEQVVERFRLRGQKYKPDLVLWFMIEADFYRFNNLLRQDLQNKAEKMKASEKFDELLTKIPYPNFEKKEVVEKLGGEENIDLIQKQYIEEISNYYSKDLVLFSSVNLAKRHKNLLENIRQKRLNTFVFNNIVDIYSENAAFPDKHPNEKGHALIAGGIFEYLKASKIITCSD